MAFNGISTKPGNWWWILVWLFCNTTKACTSIVKQRQFVESKVDKASFGEPSDGVVKVFIRHVLNGEYGI